MMIKRLLEIINVMVWVHADGNRTRDINTAAMNSERDRLLSSRRATESWKSESCSSLPKSWTKQMSHISWTNLTCDASWIGCMWAADNTTGSFSQVYSSALQLFQLFHPPFHTVDLLLLSLWKIICNNMIWDTDNKDWCDATEFVFFLEQQQELGHQSVDRPSLHHLGS